MGHINKIKAKANQIKFKNFNIGMYPQNESTKQNDNNGTVIAIANVSDKKFVSIAKILSRVLSCFVINYAFLLTQFNPRKSAFISASKRKNYIIVKYSNL